MLVLQTKELTKLLIFFKKICKDIKKKIEDFLLKYLALKLNNKSQYYPSSMGADFCGYRIFPTHRLLRKRSKIKIKKNVKKWNELYRKNKLKIKTTLQSLNSWVAHASHCNSHLLQKKIINSCDFLITDEYYSKLEKELIDLMEKKTN